MEQDQQAIFENIEKFIVGWNEDDMVAHTAMFAEDSQFIDRDGIIYNGLEEITKHEMEVREGRYCDTLARVLDVSIRFIRPDVAIAHLWWDMILPNSDGSASPIHSGTFTFVMSTKADQWLVDVSHNTFSVRP